MQAISRDSPTEEGQPTQCIPLRISTPAIPMS